jgi:hypothetical protein
MTRRVFNRASYDGRLVVCEGPWEGLQAVGLSG